MTTRMMNISLMLVTVVMRRRRRRRRTCYLALSSLSGSHALYLQKLSSSPRPTLCSSLSFGPKT
jgi:hypothetical protein